MHVELPSGCSGAFQEEIDAPMWVDLEAEAQLMAQDRSIILLKLSF